MMQKSQLSIAALTTFAAITMASCSNYDEPQLEDLQSDNFSVSSTEPNRMTLKIDASDLESWNYVSLKRKTVEKLPIPLTCEGQWDGKSGLTYLQLGNGRPEVVSSIETDAQTEPEQWDFAIHYFDVKTNNGEVAISDAKSLDNFTTNLNALSYTADVWSSSAVMVDLKNMTSMKIGYQNSYVNSVLSGWVTMDISNPPPTFSTSGAVYVLKLPDGTYAAMQLLGYCDQLGVKGNLTIDIIYPL